MLTVAGNTFWWDSQVKTFMADIGGTVIGSYSGQYATAESLTSACNITLSLEELANLNAEKPSNIPAYVSVKPIGKTEFLARFTPEEKSAIIRASKSSVEIELMLLELYLASNDAVDIAHPTLIASITALEQVGLLAVGRAAKILE